MHLNLWTMSEMVKYKGSVLLKRPRSGPIYHHLWHGSCERFCHTSISQVFWAEIRYRQFYCFFCVYLFGWVVAPSFGTHRDFYVRGVFMRRFHEFFGQKLGRDNFTALFPNVFIWSSSGSSFVWSPPWCLCYRFCHTSISRVFWAEISTYFAPRIEVRPRPYWPCSIIFN